MSGFVPIARCYTVGEEGAYSSSQAQSSATYLGNFVAVQALRHLESRIDALNISGTAAIVGGVGHLVSALLGGVFSPRIGGIWTTMDTWILPLGEALLYFLQGLIVKDAASCGEWISNALMASGRELGGTVGQGFDTLFPRRGETLTIVRQHEIVERNRLSLMQNLVILEDVAKISSGIMLVHLVGRSVVNVVDDWRYQEVGKRKKGGKSVGWQVWGSMTSIRSVWLSIAFSVSFANAMATHWGGL